MTLPEPLDEYLGSHRTFGVRHGGFGTVKVPESVDQVFKREHL